MDSVRLVTSVNQSVADSKSFISVSVNTAYPVLLAWEFAFLFYLYLLSTSNFTPTSFRGNICTLLKETVCIQADSQLKEFGKKEKE